MPTTNEITTRLQDAVKKRDSLASQVERLKGRLEEAQGNLAAVEQSCRDKNIDPDRIDEAIDKLRSRYDAAVSKLETDLSTVQEALTPYENN